MKYFNKPQINHALFVISYFSKTGNNLISENSYRKQMYNYPFKEFSKIVAADVRLLLPANLNEVVNKSLFGTLFELKKGIKCEKFSRNINQNARLNRVCEPSLSLTVKQ